MGRNLALTAASVMLILLAGCAKKPITAEPPGAPEPPPEATSAPLGGKVTAIRVYDERPEVSDSGRILHMPETTIVGESDEVHPALDDPVRDLIRSEASRRFASGKDRLEIDIYVTEGKQRFHVEEMLEVAEVQFAVRVELIAGANVRVGEGNAILSVDGVDVARSDVDALYVDAIRESVRRAFSGIERVR